MQISNTLNLNINYENIKNNKISFLINTVIPIYTIVTIVMGLYYFVTGESEFKNSEDGISVSYEIANTDKLHQRSTGIYYLLLASIGCIMIILRLLINRDWINIIGIVLIIFFILLTIHIEIETYSKDYYLDGKMELSRIGSSESIYKWISQMQHINVIKYIEDDILNDVILNENDIKQIDEIGFNFKVFCYTYLWELINITITTMCIIPTIIMLYKNKIHFNLELINVIVVSFTFVLCLVYLITNLRRKTPIKLYVTINDKSIDNNTNEFINNNKSILEKYNNLFIL